MNNEYKYPYQAGQMVSMNKSNNQRISAKQSVLAFVEATEMPQEEQLAHRFKLYFAYCKFVRLSPLDSRVISAKRFFCILDKSGYRRRPDIRGDFYENLAFIKGAWI